jgi:hypothetical protein
LHLETTLASSSGVGTSIQITSGGAGGDQAWIGVNKGTGNGLEFSVENRDIIFNTGTTTPFGGTERMRITCTGNVGIGTAAPCASLHVVPTASNSLIWPVIINNQANCGTAGYGVGLKLQNSSISGGNENNKWAGIAAIAGGSSGYSNDTDLAFYVGCFILASNATCPPVEKMRIQSSTGNVGIGTTSPAYKFVVSNSGAAGLEVDPVTPTITGGIDLLFYNRSTSAYKGASFLACQFYFGGGNVGIGTTSPAAMLDIYHPTNGYASVGLQGYAGATKWYLTSGISGDTIQDFSISNNNAGTSPKFRISSTGAATFSSSVTAVRGFFNSGGNATDPIISVTGDTNTGFFFPSADTIATTVAGTERMRIKTGGNVSAKSDVASNTVFEAWNTNTTNGYGGYIRGGQTSGDYALSVAGSSGTEYLKVRGDGYLFSAPTYNNQWPGYSANMYIASDGSMGRITASSCRFKENIIDWSGNGLDTILALKPKTFKYKKDYVNSDLNFLGLIAEDVAEVLPYLAEYENPDRTGLVENVRYDTIVVPLIAAIQEQQCTICSQASMINVLKTCLGIA